jgi:lipoprotein-anchoring transpeptidase ErfK/SrfK
MRHPSCSRIAPLVASAAVALAFAGCGATKGGAAAPALTPEGTGAAARTAPAGSGVAAIPIVSRFGRLVVRVERPTTLRARPGGRVVLALAPTTTFGSPTVLPVVRRSGNWYGVLATGVGNGRVGWISAHAALRLFVSDYRIDASLRRREVVVRHGDRVLARFPVAVGGPATPTPTGRFAVTDKLLTHDAASPYGCCIIALDAIQPRTPQGWGGGDRIAIHTTDKPATIGSAASLGCLRAPEDAMRRIIRVVPLGTVVTIRA